MATILGRDLSYINENITGTNEADILVGFSGQDRLTGRAGADLFVFTEKDIYGRFTKPSVGIDGETFPSRTLWGIDRILDYNPAEGDQIVLVGSKLDQTDIASRLSFDSNTGILSVDNIAFVQLTGSSVLPGAGGLPNGYTAGSLAELGIRMG